MTSLDLIDYRLKQLEKRFDALDEKLDVVATEIAKLKVKSGIWGILGSLVVVVPTLIAVWELVK